MLRAPLAAADRTPNIIGLRGSENQRGLLARQEFQAFTHQRLRRCGYPIRGSWELIAKPLTARYDPRQKSGIRNKVSSDDYGA
jgi:hypothetical protein